MGLILGRHAAAMPTLRQVARAGDGLAAEAARAGLVMLDGGRDAPIPDDAPVIRGSAIDPQTLIQDLTEVVARRYTVVDSPPP